MWDGSKLLSRTFVGSDGFGLGCVEWKYSYELTCGEVKNSSFIFFVGLEIWEKWRKMEKLENGLKANLWVSRLVLRMEMTKNNLFDA